MGFQHWRLYAIALKTLTSLNKESRRLFYAIIAFGVFPLFLPLVIAAFGGPEGYCSLAMIAFRAFRAFQFTVPKYYHRFGKMDFKPYLRRLRSSRWGQDYYIPFLFGELFPAVFT